MQNKRKGAIIYEKRREKTIEVSRENVEQKIFSEELNTSIEEYNQSINEIIK